MIFDAPSFDVGAKGKGYMDPMMMKWESDEDGQGYSSLILLHLFSLLMFSVNQLINIIMMKRDS